MKVAKARCVELENKAVASRYVGEQKHAEVTQEIRRQRFANQWGRAKHHAVNEVEQSRQRCVHPRPALRGSFHVPSFRGISRPCACPPDGLLVVVGCPYVTIQAPHAGSLHAGALRLPTRMCDAARLPHQLLAWRCRELLDVLSAHLIPQGGKAPRSVAALIDVMVGSKACSCSRPPRRRSHTPVLAWRHGGWRMIAFCLALFTCGRPCDLEQRSPCRCCPRPMKACVAERLICKAHHAAWVPLAHSASNPRGLVYKQDLHARRLRILRMRMCTCRRTRLITYGRSGEPSQSSAPKAGC